VALPGANGSSTRPGKGSLGSSAKLESGADARNRSGAGHAGVGPNSSGGPGSSGVLILIEFI
jgi:hypothetical protein